MTAPSSVFTPRSDVRTAMALLLLAEAMLFFTFLFVVGPIATPVLLVPLAAVVVLCVALAWGQDWVRWVLLAPIAYRAWTLVHVIAAAFGLGRMGTAVFLTLIMLVELAAAFIFVDSYRSRRRSFATALTP